MFILLECWTFDYVLCLGYQLIRISILTRQNAVSGFTNSRRRKVVELRKIPTVDTITLLWNRKSLPFGLTVFWINLVFSVRLRVYWFIMYVIVISYIFLYLYNPLKHYLIWTGLFKPFSGSKLVNFKEDEFSQELVQTMSLKSVRSIIATYFLFILPQRNVKLDKASQWFLYWQSRHWSKTHFSATIQQYIRGIYKVFLNLHFPSLWARMFT